MIGYLLFLMTIFGVGLYITNLINVKHIGNLNKIIDQNYEFNKKFTKAALKCADDLTVASEALHKIYQPEIYHRYESDPYTRAGCFQQIAKDALDKIK